MQLTQFTDYGLRSLMYLAAQPDRLYSVREIAEHYGISRNHLVKVVHRLAQLGYVTSSKGKGGGIRLACKPQELHLGDLVLALEPNLYLVECFNLKTNTCRVVSACKLKHFLGDASKAFINTLDQHTLDDVVISKQAVVGCR
ncbi:MAG: Rrf2 family transcriptional regulator [Alphaproteobacteria bacterium]|nr:Rrf2 family transcriptional regulator [Alphaproteobacteria bacterium]